MTRQYGRTLDMILTSEEQGSGIELGDLTVNFTIVKTAGRELNRARIEVFNLSRETISRISSELRRVDLLAGYGDAPGLVFSGNISNLFTRQEGPDRITEIFAQDGLRDIKTALVNANLEGATLRDAVAVITGAFEDVKIDLDTIPNTPLTPGSHVFSGYAQHALRTLENYGLSWMISDHQFRVFREGESDGADAIVVNYQTGLIGSPVSSREALEFTCLLNPAIRPLGLVEVSSATGNLVEASEQVLSSLDISGVLFGLKPGIFRVSEVVHLGETRGQSWYSKVTCHPFAGVQPNA